VSAYSGAAGKSDAAAWLSGEKSGTSAGRRSVAGQTMAALRSIGLLEEIWEGADGLVVYPNAETAHVEMMNEVKIFSD
jgi:hypothetical protein